MKWFFFSLCFSSSPFNTKGALERAKFAVETQYSVVGVLEDLNTTLAVFEKYIPRFFAGATEIYYNEIKNFNKINKNNFKPPVSEEVKNLVRQNFSREIEFYKFCKQRLNLQFLAANMMDGKWWPSNNQHGGNNNTHSQTILTFDNLLVKVLICLKLIQVQSFFPWLNPGEMGKNFHQQTLPSRSVI